MSELLIECQECEDGWLDDGDGGAWRPCMACHGTFRLTYLEACQYERSREHLEERARDGDEDAAAALDYADKQPSTPVRWICGTCKRPLITCEPTCPAQLFAEGK
jgi:hypothetical protein